MIVSFLGYNFISNRFFLQFYCSKYFKGRHFYESFSFLIEKYIFQSFQGNIFVRIYFPINGLKNIKYSYLFYLVGSQTMK